MHSVEARQAVSEHAEEIVRGFRRGIYARNVKFHIDRVTDWLGKQREARQSTEGTVEPFLSCVVLDLPAVSEEIASVVPLMRIDGSLVVWTPSITQVGQCLDVIEEHKLPLQLDRVLEFGTGISGGREWDVRYAMTRPQAKDLLGSNTEVQAGEAETDGESDRTSVSDESGDAQRSPDTGGRKVMVCRPKVGERIQGGGFVGLWKRKREAN